MKVLYNWLREFVPLEIPPQEATEVLERLGFEIASVQVFGGKLRGVVTAEVREKEKHPNADRLSLCKVFDGQQEFFVVCGAPNVAAGQNVALARVGAVLPDGETLKAAKIRGVESQGMICSSAELGLEEKSEGILILDANVPLGQDVRPLLGLDDALIEIEVTPNRRDALSVFGVARELAAGLNLPLKNLEPRARELDLSNNFSLFNEAPDLCPRYIARVIREVKVGPSPAWMVQRLARCGIRSINNIVDITNYVMLELGQPLHAFDGTKLDGHQIKIRRAHGGEKLLTLEGKTAELQPDMLVIADENKPAALAGIMGGQESAIDAKTQEIILESAAFQPSSIRRTGKVLGISSESSYRFERGSDWNMVALASRRAAQLIQELAGGLGAKPVESAPATPSQAPIKLRSERIRQFLGIDLKDSAAADLLRRLGCVINTGSAQLHVTAPSWRNDLLNESDLMEEIARLYGYDNIPTHSPAIHLTTVPEDTLWPFERHATSVLAGLGFSEASNYSFLSQKQAQPFIPGLGQSPDSRPIALANPLSQDQAFLRNSLLPWLFANTIFNFHRQTPGVRLFESGRIFFQNKEGRHEVRRIGLLMAGEIESAHWRQKKKLADFYELSGILLAFLRALQIPHVKLSVHRLSIFHPKRSSLILSGNTVLGWMGEVHPDLKAALDTSEPLAAAELDTAALHAVVPGSLTYHPASTFPPVRRDLSMVAPQSAAYERIVSTLKGAAGATLESVSLIDLYQGEKIGSEKKSLTVSLVFRQPDRTLTDAEVEKLMQKILADLQKKCDTTIRT